MRRLGLLVICVFLPLLLFACSAQSEMEKIGISRGICVLLGDETGDLALRLARETELLIYLQLEDGEVVEAARHSIDEAGYYGSRVWVEKGNLEHIHLADNLVDVLVATGEVAEKLEAGEVLRVLRPGGTALLAGRELTKPFPEGVDEWSHPYHGPDNNPQSEDQLARAPYLTQFLAEPYYAPLTQVGVASAGRVFKAFGNIAFHEREEALLNSLVAFNGYNGTMLWRRRLSPGVMLHRNTMIATPEILYVGDHQSCKRIDTISGRLIDEIIPPEDVAGGTFWKWMAMEDGILYALVGEQEQKDPVVRQRRQSHGWPWDPVSPGFNRSENPWGFGRNLLAIDPESKRVLWSHHEEDPVDSRALCMKNRRIYIYRDGAYLACLDATNGETLWRKTPQNGTELFEALGRSLNRQDWRTNWRTANYLKCSDEALYFAGPTIGKLLAASTEDGSVLWEHPYDNFQLVLREDGLYGISGEVDGHNSLRFDPLTGEILAEIETHRRGCTRPNGSVDAILYRARGGSVRLDVKSQAPQWISPMRAQCQDGVTIANGLLYWWPSVCDCQNTLYGLTCLGPAGDFDFSQEARESERLEMGSGDISQVAALPESPNDWPTFRADNLGSATVDAEIAENPTRLWWHNWSTSFTPTPPVAAGGLVFLGGSDGIVRALDAQQGTVRWKAYTGGAIRFPPTLWKNRLYVGSADGYVYSYEAATGRLLWRFRAAPIHRKIPVYNSFMSTWPVAGGVLVQDGVAYAAAGIVNYDGVHVYALDAETGRIRWQNNSSGHLNQEARTGVSVQGHMLILDGKLYLAGGTSVSPAVYDLATGECLNDPAPLDLVGSMSVRGQELFKVGDQVIVSGKPLYADPEHPVYDPSVLRKILHTSAHGRDVVWLDSRKLVCYREIATEALNRCVAKPPTEPAWVIGGWGKLDIPQRPLWKQDCEGSVAFARARNVLLLAKPHLEQVADGVSLGQSHGIEMIDIKTGERLENWMPLQEPPLPWGLAVDSAGRVFVTMKGGNIMCFGQEG